MLGVESAALIYSEETQSDAAAGQASAFEALGIPINVVPYSQNTADLTVPLLAAGAQDADIVMPVIAAPECVKFAEAQRALQIPDDKVLASPVCLTPAVIEGLGDFPEWYYAITTSLGSDANDPAVVPYQAFLTEIGQEQFIPDPWVLVGFGQAMTLAKWLNAIGPDAISTEAILEQMAAFEGPLILGSPVVDCGKYPEAPGSVRRPHAVLPVQRRGVRAGQRLPAAARRMGVAPLTYLAVTPEPGRRPDPRRHAL